MEKFSSRGPDPEVMRRRSAPLQLSDYWQSFPSLDAIILPTGDIDQANIQVEDFKALNNLDMARLNPQCLGALFKRGQEIDIHRHVQTMSFDLYKEAIGMLAKGKLVICHPTKASTENAIKISRFLSLKIVYWQMITLRRTCREPGLAVFGGKWATRN
jgi:hypothetical protein